MMRLFDIFRSFKRNIKLFLSLGCVLVLSACGDDCPTVQEAATGACPLCRLFELLTDSAAEMAENSWGNFALSLSYVVVVVAAIYIALYTLRMVSSFGKQTLDDYLTGDKRGLFIFMFKVTIIYLLLRGNPKAAFNPEHIEFLEYILGPLLSAGIEIGAKVSVPGVELADPIEVHNWKDIFEMLFNATVTFNNNIQFVSGLGEVLSCDAVLSWKPWEWKFLQLIYGTLIFCYGWILLIGISFFMLDVVISLAFAAALLPAGIAMAVSHLSMPYAKTIWGLFLNVFFNLIMLGIIMGIVIQGVFFCIAGQSAEDVSTPHGVHSLSFDLQAAIDSNRIAEISDAFSLFGYMLLTIVCFAVLFQLITQVGSLASEVSDTAGGVTTTQSMAAPVGKAAAQQGKQVMNWAGGVVKSGAKQIGHDISRATRLDKAYRWSTDKLATLRGFTTGTGSKGYKAFWRKLFK